MGWIKLTQSVLFYAATIGYTIIGKPEMAVLYLIAACVCDVAYILEERLPE